jgi:hypothetical protein
MAHESIVCKHYELRVTNGVVSKIVSSNLMHTFEAMKDRVQNNISHHSFPGYILCSLCGTRTKVHVQ